VELRTAVIQRPDEAQGHHLLGTVLIKMNRSGEAIDEFRQAIRLDGSLAEARVSLAQALAKAGRMDEAREQQAELERINRENADAGRTPVLLQTGAERLSKDDVAGALARFREAAALAPGLVAAHRELARMALNARDGIAAIDELRTILVWQPNRPRAARGARERAASDRRS
jgi:cytochrome c-type biogenesis protein CcmH/NrfG